MHRGQVILYVCSMKVACTKQTPMAGYWALSGASESKKGCKAYMQTYAHKHTPDGSVYISAWNGSFGRLIKQRRLVAKKPVPEQIRFKRTELYLHRTNQTKHICTTIVYNQQRHIQSNICIHILVDTASLQREYNITELM